MLGLTVWDYILFPVYLLILSAIARKIKSKYKDDPSLKFYFKWGFRYKIVLVTAFTLLTNYYMKGDNLDLYYGEGKNFANIINERARHGKVAFYKGRRRA